jgi:hypothetical protein
MTNYQVNLISAESIWLDNTFCNSENHFSTFYFSYYFAPDTHSPDLYTENCSLKDTVGWARSVSSRKRECIERIRSSEEFSWKNQLGRNHLLYTLAQRVLNDLQRTRLSRRRITWLLSHPLPSLPSASSTGRHTGRLRKCDKNLLGEGGEGGEGAKSYDGEKAWSSINHSILSALAHWQIKRKDPAPPKIPGKQ